VKFNHHEERARATSYKALRAPRSRKLASKRLPAGEDHHPQVRFSRTSNPSPIRSVGGKGVPDVIHASLMPLGSDACR